MYTETHPRTHTHAHVQQGRGIPRVRARGYMLGMGGVPALAVSERAGAEQLVVGAAVAGAAVVAADDVDVHEPAFEECRIHHVRDGTGVVHRRTLFEPEDPVVRLREESLQARL